MKLEIGRKGPMGDIALKNEHGNVIGWIYAEVDAEEIVKRVNACNNITLKRPSILSLREEIPIDELKTRKNQLDILTMKNPATGEVDEMAKKYEDIAKLTDTAILNYGRWQQEQQRNRELVKDLKDVLEQFKYNYKLDLDFNEGCKNGVYVRGKLKVIEIALSALDGICIKLGLEN